MKIVVLNGSPKGDKSVTMQYIKYLEKTFTDIDFIRINAASKIGIYKKNPEASEKMFAQLKECDGIIMAFPLYYLLTSSSFKEFIEYLYENNVSEILNGRYSAVLTTSIHYFDNTAVNYAEAVCEDWGLKNAGAFTAKMDDLQYQHFREALEFFFNSLIQKIENQTPVFRGYPQLDLSPEIEYPSLDTGTIYQNKKVAIVSDNQNPNVLKMKEMALKTFPGAKILDLDKIKMGRCLGCLKCGFDNICAYEGKDDFIEAHKSTIVTSDIIIYCLTMKDRYFSYLWQRSLERSFYKTHQPVLKGKQIAFLVSGKLENNFCARNTLESYIGTMASSNCRFLNDSLSPGEFTTAFEQLSKELVDSSEKQIAMPADCRGISGMKIFRDDIMGGLRGVFQKDHQYYRRHGIYDFPNKKPLKMLGMTLFTLFSRIPPVRKKIRNNFADFMLMPYQPLFKRLFGE